MHKGWRKTGIVLGILGGFLVLEGLSPGVLLAGPSLPEAGKVGILILFYIYPSSSKWDQLIALKMGYPAVPILAIARIPEGNKITKMVFIEYSYEHDGYPIIGVGRYFQ
ncbi:MAG: spherulation-specific family 4 protein [Candidatus Omnitrophica bacterium]|nr:spherulation-specific family 4 protein [Candidatus Omnitrophota bacterium]